MDSADDPVSHHDTHTGSQCGLLRSKCPKLDKSIGLTEEDEMATNSGWRRSSRCQHADCVEIAVVSGSVLIRDSKRGTNGPVLAFTTEQFRLFIAAAKADTLRP
jgi:hypothetical protein